jgi:heme-degrading monooxygenase HmoA
LVVAYRRSDKIKMYTIIWEYRIRTERVDEFEQIYHPGGKWTELFKKGTGYLGSDLLCDPEDKQRYMTIDRWVSSEDYESFLSQWKKEYEALDLQCEGLTEEEALLGKWKAVTYETR